MTGCPFGFHSSSAADDCSGDEAELHSSEGAPSETPIKGTKKQANSDGGSEVDDDDRFDPAKDPVAWFYQNQIKGEEEFQRNKAKLRAAARDKLKEIMEKKGKLAEFDSEVDDSMDESELSAWDSDVDSLSSLVSCAESWAAEERFEKPAEGWFQQASVVLLAVAVYCGYTAWGIRSSSARLYGILSSAWLTTAALPVAFLTLTLAAAALAAPRLKSKRLVLGVQIGCHVAYAACAALGIAACLAPLGVEPRIRETACRSYDSTNPDLKPRLCGMLPQIDAEVASLVWRLRWLGAGGAAGSLALLAMASWYLHELFFVEKRAIKHKRRRRRRKFTIPWHKIKVIGKTTDCGAAAASKPAEEGAPAAGGCPFSGAAGGSKGDAKSPGACPFNPASKPSTKPVGGKVKKAEPKASGCPVMH